MCPGSPAEAGIAVSSDWVEVRRPKNGEASGLCLSAQEHLSVAGNNCIKWTFDVDGMRHDFFTPLHGSKALMAYETVLALGLDPSATRLSDARGKLCRVFFKDGSINKVREP